MSKKSRNSGKVHRLDRNKSVGPMTDFIRIPDPPGAKEAGIIATFENNKYGVFLKKSYSEGLGMAGPDGAQGEAEIIHMIIVRLDKKKIEIPWEDKQQIKNFLLGPMCEAVELFPMEMRRMTSIVDHQCHIWAFQPGTHIPLGLVPHAMQDLIREDALEGLSADAEELKVYQVEDNGLMQVYASEEEARALYKEAGNEMPEGFAGRIGGVAIDGEHVVWSDSAKAKIANVLAMADKLELLLNPGKPQGDATVVNTNGPPTDQDELEEQMGVGDHAPNSDEEDVMSPEFMEMGLKQLSQSRSKSVAEAVIKLVSRHAENKERAVKEREDEEKAAKELDESREQARIERAKLEVAEDSSEEN